MSTDSMEKIETVPNSIIRSGWLWRQGRHLKQWKLSWIILWRSGRLMVYSDTSSGVAKDVINVPFENVKILKYNQCLLQNLPEGLSERNAFGIQTDSKIWFLIAETGDERDEWVRALEEALHDNNWYSYFTRTPDNENLPFAVPVVRRRHSYVPDYKACHSSDDHSNEDYLKRSDSDNDFLKFPSSGVSNSKFVRCLLCPVTWWWPYPYGYC